MFVSTSLLTSVFLFALCGLVSSRDLRRAPTDYIGKSAYDVPACSGAGSQWLDSADQEMVAYNFGSFSIPFLIETFVYRCSSCSGASCPIVDICLFDGPPVGSNRPKYCLPAGTRLDCDGDTIRTITGLSSSLIFLSDIAWIVVALRETGAFYFWQCYGEISTAPTPAQRWSHGSTLDMRISDMPSTWDLIENPITSSDPLRYKVGDADFGVVAIPYTCDPPCDLPLYYCSATDVCSCVGGYYGPNCTLFDCDGLPSGGCLNNGTCTSPDVCSCPGGFTGVDCGAVVCGAVVGGCVEGQGVCQEDSYCECDSDWRGDDCSIPMCSFECQHDAICVSADYCDCPLQWIGDDCSVPLCSFECLNEGSCTSQDECTCNTGWGGNDCSVNTLQQTYLGVGIGIPAALLIICCIAMVGMVYYCRKRIKKRMRERELRQPESRSPYVPPVRAPATRPLDDFHGGVGSCAANSAPNPSPAVSAPVAPSPPPVYAPVPPPAVVPVAAPASDYAPAPVPFEPNHNIESRWQGLGAGAGAGAGVPSPFDTQASLTPFAVSYRGGGVETPKGDTEGLYEVQYENIPEVKYEL